MKQKKLIIKEENREEIIKYLQSKRGKERERLMTIDDIFNAVKIAEKKSSKLIKRLLKGFTFKYCLNDKKSSSYKYSYQADCISIEWTNKGWNLLSHWRAPFFPNQKDQSHFFWHLPREEVKLIMEEVNEILMKKFLNEF